MYKDNFKLYFLTPFHMKHTHHYLSELIATFALTLAVLLTLKVGGLATPIAAALTLGLFVYTVGGISGAHVNPAITIGLLAVEKISPSKAVGYIIAQLAGAGLAMILVQNTVTLPAVGVDPDIWKIGIAEALGTAFLAWGVMAVVAGKISDAASGLVIGGSLLLGIIIAAALGANGALNPAVAFGINSWSIAYFVAPIIGSVLAMLLYRFVSSRS